MLYYIYVSGSEFLGDKYPQTRDKIIRKYVPYTEAKFKMVYGSENRQNFLWLYYKSAHEIQLYDKGRYLMLLNGYFSEDAEDAINHKLNCENGICDFMSSPGGIYTFIAIERATGALSCVQSLSGGNFPVYLAQKPGKAAISNLPSLAHMAISSYARPELDFGFSLAILEGLYDISGHTPFPDTMHADKDMTIYIKDGAVRQRRRNKFYIEVPDGLDVEVELASEILGQAARQSAKMGKPVLYLSGGKDSRLLAALYSHEDLDIDIINLNSPEHYEGKLAQEIANNCGYSLSYQVVAPEEDIINNTNKQFLARGGMPLSVPLHYPYEPYTRLAPEKITLMRHAHHQRGGLALGMSVPGKDYYKYIMNKFFDNFIKDQFKHNEIIIKEFYNKTFFNHIHELLYIVNRDIRFPRYNAPSMNQYSYYAPIVMPLLDERFTLFINGMLGYNDRRFALFSELLVFKIINRLNKNVRDIPLDHKNWRFEANGPLAGHEDGFESRNYLNNMKRYNDLKVKSEQLSYYKSKKFISSFVREYIVSSDIGRSLLAFMKEEFTKYVLNFNAFETMAENYMFALFGLAFLYGSDSPFVEA